MEDAQLRTVWQQRQIDDHIAHVSQPLAILTKHVLAKRFRQLRDLAAIWDELIPEPIAEHTALESFSHSRGVLTVVVDSAAHRFQLRTLLDGGILREIQARFGGSLNKVRLVPGQFYSVDLAGRPRYEFPAQSS
jgi:hypothetical protein